MSLWETFGIAIEGIMSNKARSLLTMLGIIIGVAAVIVMTAVSAGTETTIADQIGTLGANLIIVSNQRMGGGGGGNFEAPILSSSATNAWGEEAAATSRRWSMTMRWPSNRGWAVSTVWLPNR